MIRSSRHHFPECNRGKREAITSFILRYRFMLKKFVNILWNDFQDRSPSFMGSATCNRIATGAHGDSRIRQCAAKQACAIVNGVLDKRRRQIYMLKKLQREGKDTKYFQRKIDCSRISRPDIDKVNPELDPRFIDIQETDGEFDLFVRLSQLGDKLDIRIPIRHNKVSNKWRKLGAIKGSVRLSENHVTLFYELPEPSKRAEGRVLGADQGLVTTLSLSDGQTTGKDIHGHDLGSICSRLARRKKGSKGFKRTQEHRSNYINWSLNQLNFDGVREVRLERIFNLRKGRNSGRRMSHWAYAGIKSKLVRLGEVEGFNLVEQDNKFRSQRCSRCGWVHRSNRKGKTFRCSSGNCGHVADADLNAASNHETELCDVGEAWRNRLNRTSGFYWMEDGIYDCGKESIVPCAEKGFQWFVQLLSPWRAPHGEGSRGSAGNSQARSQCRIQKSQEHDPDTGVLRPRRRRRGDILRAQRDDRETPGQGAGQGHDEIQPQAPRETERLPRHLPAATP